MIVLCTDVMVVLLNGPVTLLILWSIIRMPTYSEPIYYLLPGRCDGFSEWASSIGVHCCHLESILSVWSKTINDASCCHY